MYYDKLSIIILVHKFILHTGKLMAESMYTITTAELMLVTRSSWVSVKA